MSEKTFPIGYEEKANKRRKELYRKIKKIQLLDEEIQNLQKELNCTSIQSRFEILDL